MKTLVLVYAVAALLALTACSVDRRTQTGADQIGEAARAAGLLSVAELCAKSSEERGEEGDEICRMHEEEESTVSSRNTEGAIATANDALSGAYRPIRGIIFDCRDMGLVGQGGRTHLSFYRSRISRQLVYYREHSCAASSQYPSMDVFYDVPGTNLKCSQPPIRLMANGVAFVVGQGVRNASYASTSCHNLVPAHLKHLSPWRNFTF